LPLGRAHVHHTLEKGARCHNHTRGSKLPPVRTLDSARRTVGIC
jgi:hypothetical protein